MAKDRGVHYATAGYSADAGYSAHRLDYSSGVLEVLGCIGCVYSHG